MIIALEEAKYALIAMRADIDDLGSALRVQELRATAEELDKQTLDPDFGLMPKIHPRYFRK